MERKTLLRKLLNFDGKLEAVSYELKKYDWDSEELVSLQAYHIVDILKNYLAKVITEKDVEDWADSIEGREDIEINPEFIEILHELANPYLCGNLTVNRAAKILQQLSVT